MNSRASAIRAWVGRGGGENQDTCISSSTHSCTHTLLHSCVSSSLAHSLPCILPPSHPHSPAPQTPTNPPNDTHAQSAQCRVHRMSCHRPISFSCSTNSTKVATRTRRVGWNCLHPANLTHDTPLSGISHLSPHRRGVSTCNTAPYNANSVTQMATILASLNMWHLTARFVVVWWRRWRRAGGGPASQQTKSCSNGKKDTRTHPHTRFESDDT
jgi:hypothetical protein